jgi:hypothetical protein
MIGNHTQRVWSDATGEALIEAFSISNMAHGVPLATTGSHCGGAAGAFFLDAGISSTHHIARFWHLRESLDEMPQTDAPESVERLSPEKPSPRRPVRLMLTSLRILWVKSGRHVTRSTRVQ